MDQGCKKFTTQAIASLIALKRRSFRFELTTNEGEPAAKVEHFESIFESRCARKKLAGLLNRLPRLQPWFSITRVDF
jgi:hypothetical protein